MFKCAWRGHDERYRTLSRSPVEEVLDPKQHVRRDQRRGKHKVHCYNTISERGETPKGLLLGGGASVAYTRSFFTEIAGAVWLELIARRKPYIDISRDNADVLSVQKKPFNSVGKDRCKTGRKEVLHATENETSKPHQWPEGSTYFLGEIHISNKHLNSGITGLRWLT